MDVSKEIEVVKELLENAIAVVPDNDLFEQHQSRIIANYSQALKTLIEIERMLKK